MRISRGLVVAGVLVGLLTPSANAAPKPQITDGKGDYPVGSADIISVTFSTLPKGTKEYLQIEMVVAQAPSTTPPYSYQVDFKTEDGCDFGAIYFNSPLGGESGVGCRKSGETSLPAGNAKIVGNKITFLVAMSGATKRGVEIEQLRASTSPSGLVSGGLLAYAGDMARSDETWVIGSDRPQKKKK